MTLGVNVTYTMQPGKRQAYLDALGKLGLPRLVQQEEGCLAYDYYLDAQDPDRLLLVERWTDRAAQQVHLTQPHMTAAMALKGDYVADTALVCYDLE